VEDKEGPSLAIVFARELAELMGGNPSRLHKWGVSLGLPVPKARQTFYSHLEHGWKLDSEPASTETCRLGSYPMNCELRLRVVSLVTQFSSDVRSGKKRQLIVLMGYEVCSHLIHFRVYRGPDFEDDKEHGIPLCDRLPIATVAAFVRECGRMVGLPLRRVLLTQKLMDFQPKRGKASLLSLTPPGKVTAWEWRDEIDDNEVLCSFVSKPYLTLRQDHSLIDWNKIDDAELCSFASKPYDTLVGDHPFIKWCKTTTVKKLTAALSDLVNRHNKATALSDRVKRKNKEKVEPCLYTAQRVLDALLKKSHDAVEARRGTSRWTSAVLPSPLEIRLKKHDYALEPYSLREVGLYRGEYDDFWKYPGDHGRVSK
jgi:hypothetical protein